MNFKDFAYFNRHRSESPAGFNLPLSRWSASDYLVEAMGEFGEAANVVKKLNRYRAEARGNSESLEQLQSMLSDEIADAFITLDLLVQSQGIDLETAIVSKFNKTSRKIGYPHILRAESETIRKSQSQ